MRNIACALDTFVDVVVLTFSFGTWICPVARRAGFCSLLKMAAGMSSSLSLAVCMAKSRARARKPSLTTVISGSLTLTAAIGAQKKRKDRLQLEILIFK